MRLLPPVPPVPPVLLLSLLLSPVVCLAHPPDATISTTPTAAPTATPTATPTSAPTAAPPATATVPDGEGTAVYADGDVVWQYHPTPTLVTDVTRVDKPAYPAIDIHCHWTLEQDPDELLAAMDKLGVKAAVNLSGGSGERFDAMIERFHKPAPDRLLILCNLDFTDIGREGWTRSQVEWLREARRKGAAGLKIFKSLGLTIKDTDGELVPVDDPRLDPIWAECGKLNMPVLIHTADPIAFFQPIDRDNERWMQLHRHPDWSFDGDGFPTRDELLAQRNRMIAKHPQTTYIGAHVANNAEDLKRVGRDLDDLPNLVLDISGRVAELGRQPYAARKFVVKYQDRVLFGTDRYPGRPDQPRYTIYYRFLETDDEYFDYYDHPFPPTGDWNIYGIFLPDEVLKKVYLTNAQRVLKLD